MYQMVGNWYPWFWWNFCTMWPIQAIQVMGSVAWISASPHTGCQQSFICCILVDNSYIILFTVNVNYLILHSKTKSVHIALTCEGFTPLPPIFRAPVVCVIQTPDFVGMTDVIFICYRQRGKMQWKKHVRVELGPLWKQVEVRETTKP